MIYKEPKVIAEIGCNHKGEMEIAKELIQLAKFCNADVAKFQKRNNKELLTEEQYNAPHPNQRNAYGETYGEHREKLEIAMEAANYHSFELDFATFKITTHKEIYASLGFETSEIDELVQKFDSLINPNDYDSQREVGGNVM